MMERGLYEREIAVESGSIRESERERDRKKKGERKEPIDGNERERKASLWKSFV